MIRSFLICGLLAFGIFQSGNVLAQQDAQFSQYMFNTLFYNPGYAGVEGLTTVKFIHRSQWAGYKGSFAGEQGGAPTTQVVSLTTPVLRYRSGVGLHIVNDNLGPLNNLEAQFSYAYQVGIGDSKLSLGIRGGVFSKTIDFSKYRPIDPGDPLIQEGKESQIQPDMGAGIFFRANDYYGGVSFNHLLDTQFDFGLDSLRNPLVKHMVATGGFDFEPTFKIKLTPSFLVKSDFNSYQFDVGILATYDENLWGGLSFRQSEAAIAMLGYGFFDNQALKISYSFDYVVNAQEAKRPTSHEIMVSYSLPVVSADDKKIIRTPRFRQ